ncbi:hypothetical protein J8273_2316 [Carpediemonas membranifera]|uniref:WD40 repeat-like protein n=1 Tax=Carpediemonas membranifera TaxID=201153 RepID=A0A8J6BET6_9EUKA|nr:hypothetical protein J8273_2316 [Carpediemonas membranifera]|eukprot:KAG9395967.1 hypothetical protein J8273_2316 [Carpediemonas membranifera]
MASLRYDYSLKPATESILDGSIHQVIEISQSDFVTPFSTASTGGYVQYSQHSGTLTFKPTVRHNRPVTHSVYSPKHDLLITGASDGSLVLGSPGKRGARAHPVNGELAGIELTTDGDAAVVVSKAGVVAIVELPELEVTTFDTSGPVDAIAILDDDSVALFDRDPDSVYSVWSLTRQQRMSVVGSAEIRSQIGVPTVVCINGDQTRIVSAHGIVCQLWGADSGRPLVQWRMTSGITSLAWMDTMLLVGHNDGTLSMWTVTDRKATSMLSNKSHRSKVTAIGVGNKAVLSVESTGRICFWKYVLDPVNTPSRSPSVLPVDPYSGSVPATPSSLHQSTVPATPTTTRVERADDFGEPASEQTIVDMLDEMTTMLSTALQRMGRLEARMASLEARLNAK